jgi:hypothetical protein
MSPRAVSHQRILCGAAVCCAPFDTSEVTFYLTRAGPLSTVQWGPSAGPYTIDPHSHSHVRCRSWQAQTAVPTRTPPGVIGWPLPQRSGGRTHSPFLDRTRSPTPWLIRPVYPTAATVESGLRLPRSLKRDVDLENNREVGDAGMLGPAVNFSSKYRVVAAGS